tara:strand:+ start:39 stop:491 length:453 start_codon:yes stop_codon:yes gene_type:complete
MCVNKNNEEKSRYELNREERSKILDDLDLKHTMFINALDNFRGKGDQDVPKAELKKFKFMEWVYLNDKVKFRRRNDIEDMLMFDCVMEKGGEFGMHLHSDCVEMTEIVQGELFDLQTNTTYAENELVIFPKNKKHIPIATQDTVLRVFFR